MFKIYALYFGGGHAQGERAPGKRRLERNDEPIESVSIDQLRLAVGWCGDLEIPADIQEAARAELTRRGWSAE